MSKYTPELAEKIATLVASGLDQKTAAAIAGVHEVTLCNWLKNHINFANLLEQKRGEAIQRALSQVQAAAEKQWQAAAWYLERTQPDKFALQTRIRGDVKVEVQVRDVARDGPKVLPAPDPDVLKNALKDTKGIE